ncbi:MAG: hypothetical protein PUB00_02780 [Clostridiales bacterium]|nr:hypothetical protein [Clostridiales bacterium]
MIWHNLNIFNPDDVEMFKNEVYTTYPKEWIPSHVNRFRQFDEYEPGSEKTLPKILQVTEETPNSNINVLYHMTIKK